MPKKLPVYLLLLVLSSSLRSQTIEPSISSGKQETINEVSKEVSIQAKTIWKLAGKGASDYSMSIEPSDNGDVYSVCLRSITKNAHSFGTIMRTSKAAAKQFQNKRIRLTALVKAQDVTDWAGLWMRVDARSGDVLAFDNMHKRPIKGTSEWTKYSIVLDVSSLANSISFGLLLSCTGSVSIDTIMFNEVDLDTPTTS